MAQLSFIQETLISQVERCQMDTLRLSMGINPEGFKWKLDSEEEFCFSGSCTYILLQRYWSDVQKLP